MPSAFRLRRNTRHLVAWWAALSLVLMLLAPTVAQALRASGDAAWAVVCTTPRAGGQAVAPGQQPLADIHGALSQCPCCQLAAADLAPAPPPPTVALPTRLRWQLPAAFLSAPHTLHAWRSAQPRAPPSLS